MILAWKRDIVNISQRYTRVHHLVSFGNKSVPFVVVRHRNWAYAKLLCSVEGLVRFPFENTGIGIVSLLDLADNNGLEFTAGVFKVQIGLATC
jgi:hypothetical protein